MSGGRFCPGACPAFVRRPAPGAQAWWPYPPAGQPARPAPRTRTNQEKWHASTAAGAKIIQYDQNGTTNGLWKPIALPTGSWRFQNLNSGQCLDVPGYSTSPGVQLDQQPCPVDPVEAEQTFDTR